MGVEQLNVADTIVAIMQDNLALCATVSESFLRIFCDAIKMWGRKARWLNFFTVFLVQKGRAMKRNQDLLLRVLLDDKDALLDLSGDYSSSPYLSKSDGRYGMSRLDLMIAKDHKRAVFSLLKYHVTTLTVLAMSCWGKNSQNQAKLAQEVDLGIVMKSILDLDLRPDGERDPRVGDDAIRYIQQGWLMILTDVYLNNPDSAAIAEVQAETHIVGDLEGMHMLSSIALLCVYMCRKGRKEKPIKRKLDEYKEYRECCMTSVIFSHLLNGQTRPADFYNHAGHPSLLQVISTNMDSLNERLKILDVEDYSSDPELLQQIVDGHGNGLYNHFMCVKEMVRTCQAFYSKYNTFVERPTEDIARLSTLVRNSTVSLYTTVGRLKYNKMVESMVELITCLTSRGVEGRRFDLVIDETPLSPRLAGVERSFQEGWTMFRTLASYKIGINPTEGREMDDAIKDIALLFGSSSSHQNSRFQSLKELLTMVKDPSSDSSAKITGIKSVRALLYMIPDDLHASVDQQATEYERLCQNLPPARLGTPEFLRLQERVASLGGVDAVTSCLLSDDADGNASTGYCHARRWK